MTHEITAVLNEVVESALLSAPSADWTSVELIRRRIGTYGEFEVHYYGTWGDESKQTGILDTHLPIGKRTHKKLDGLRELMYKTDSTLGAWYTCIMCIATDGNFTVYFDYDNPPAWSMQPSEEELALDFKQFPRKADTIPEWIKPILNKFTGKYKFAM